MSPTRRRMLPVTTNSEEARRQFELGRHAAFHYQSARAYKHLDAAIAADSSFVLAYLHRGGMSSRYERQRYFDLAEKYKDRVTEDEERMIEAFFAFLWYDDADKAVQIFSELASKYTDDPYLPTYLGLRYLRNLRRPGEAKEQFERALRRDPTFAQAYNWLGYVAMAQEDYAAAEDAFRKYLELAPDQPRPYDSLGSLYLRTGRPEEAAAQFERALVCEPGFTASAEKLARIHIERANARFAQAFSRGDSEGTAELYAADAQLMPAGIAAVEEPAAIGRYWQEAFAAGFTGVRLETREVFLGAEGDFATEVGHYSLTAGNQEAEAGNYVVIWTRLHSATPEDWQRYRHIWTSDSKT
jgi:Flp pilus assembly protein TadD